MNFFELFSKFLNVLTRVYKTIKETLLSEFEKFIVYKITIVEPFKKTEKPEEQETDLYNALLDGKLFQAIATNEIKKGNLFNKVITPFKNTPDEDV